MAAHKHYPPTAARSSSSALSSSAEEQLSMATIARVLEEDDKQEAKERAVKAAASTSSNSSSSSAHKRPKAGGGLNSSAQAAVVVAAVVSTARQSYPANRGPSANPLSRFVVHSLFCSLPPASYIAARAFMFVSQGHLAKVTSVDQVHAMVARLMEDKKNPACDSQHSRVSAVGSAAQHIPCGPR